MPTTNDRPKCTRCGMCCIVGPCGLSDEDENGVCKELVVHEDLTTSCRIIERTGFKGTGCSLRGIREVIDAYEEMYDLNWIKKQLLKKARRHVKHRTNCI